MNCDEVRELLPAYALNALEASERDAVEEHLAECSLHPELLGYWSAARVLAAAVIEREPPSRLRARVLDHARAAPAPVELASRRDSGRAWWRWPGALAAAAVLAFFAIALGTWGLTRSVSTGQPALVREVTASTGAGLRVEYRPDQAHAELTASALAALPDGRTYQLWIIRAGEQPRSLGLLTLRSGGAARAELDLTLSTGDTIAITEEPAGGSPQPTSEPLLALAI